MITGEKTYNRENMIKFLKDYFERREDVAFAFLFGSAVRSKIRKEGDIDVAIYFYPEKDIEWEAFGKRYKNENNIGLELERFLKKDIDLIVLNRARAVLADEIIRKGEPIIIKDWGKFLDFFCLITDEAEYVRDSLNKHYRERKIESIG